MDQIQEKYSLDISEYNIQESDLDIEELSDKLEVLNKKIYKIKDVNLTAIEDYEETLKRYTFLKEQRDDLLASKEELKKVIDKINRVCTSKI